MPFFIKSILILFILLGVNSTTVYTQSIIPDEKRLDYSCEDKRFRDVMFEISELTGINIAWQESIIPSDSIVSISVRNERLGKLLDYLIKDHGLSYKIVGDQILLTIDRLAGIKEKFTISGYVRDSESGETLVDAHLLTYDNSDQAFSNEYGFYSMSLPKGLQRIYISYLGYDRTIHELFLNSDTVLHIELKPSNYIREIVISESKIKPLNSNSESIASSYELPVDLLKYSLPLAGEADVMRKLMSSSGISTGADGFGGMSVRGGAENQNLVLFDGVPVYNSNHAFGLFSIFNTAVIKSARMYKAAMPAHYSGRLSSVLDIRTREGNYKHLSGNVSLGLLTASASIEGPIVKEKASFLLSARRTFVDPWIGTLTEVLNERIGKSGRTDLYFYDINAKLNFSLGKSSKIYFSYYSGQDNFDNNTSSQSEDNVFNLLDSSSILWDAGNTLLSARWNIKLGSKLFANATIYRSQYYLRSFDLDRIELSDKNNSEFVSASFDAAYYQSDIEDRGARIEFDYIPSTKNTLRFGAGYVQHSFNPAFILADERDSIVPIEVAVSQIELRNQISESSINAREIEFFISDEIKFGRNTRLSLGYNHLLLNTGNRNYNISQPRILFRTGSDNYSFKASWGRMGQFIHSLANTGLGVPIEVWLPSTDQLAPEEAWISSVGQFYKTKRMGTFGMELFYKEMQNITRYGNENLIEISENSGWEKLLPVGEGRSYGAEFSLIKNTGKTSYNVSYTLSWSDRRFDGFNAGEYFRFRYDRRHMFNFSFVHRINQDIDFAANWQYASGAPVTLPTGGRYFEYKDDGSDPELILIYDGINESVLPDYHRLDFGFNFRTEYDWGHSLLTIGLYNSYNRQNTFYRDIIVDLGNPEQPVRFEDITILPVLPTISYSISF